MEENLIFSYERQPTLEDDLNSFHMEDNLEKNATKDNALKTNKC